MQDGRNCESGVERPDGGAVVGELFIACMGERFAFGMDAWEEKVTCSFEEEEGPVHSPGFG